MENKSHAMAAGIFVVSLLALLVAMFVWLTRDQHNYTAFEMSTEGSISGLQSQAVVRYKGVAVGKVVDIDFDPEVTGNILIRIEVESDAPISPQTTYAKLGYQGVTGIAHVQLDDQAEPITPLPRGMSGVARLPMRTSPLNQLADQGMVILGGAGEAVRRINLMLNNENRQRFGELLENLNVATKNAATLMQHLDEQLKPTVEQIPALTQEARRAMQSLQQAGQEAAALARKVQAQGGALERITEGTQSLARAAERLDRSTLPVLNQAADDVAAAARAIGQTAGQVSENPQALLYGDRPIPPGPGEAGFVAPVPAH